MLNQLYQQATKLIAQKAYQQAHQCLLKILSQDRGYADAYYLMAVIAAEHGNFAKAISIAERAESLEEKPSYGVFIAKLFVQLHDHVQAKLWADKVTAKLPTAQLTAAQFTGQMLDDLGVVYSQVGQHRLATTMFEKALAVSDGKKLSAQLLTNLASSYKFCGDFDAAKRHYLDALDKTSDCYLALWSLASLGELPSTQQVVELTQLLDENSKIKGANPSINDKLHIAHTLARYHETHGNYGLAYELLAKTKQEKKQQLGYQFQDDLVVFEALAERFAVNHQLENAVNRERLDNIQSTKGALSELGNEAIFIVGMPRTGTTVVERLLSQPDNITSAGEMQHFSIALKQMSKTASSGLLDLDVISASENIDWQALGKRYIDSTRAITGTTSKFIDKMPLNFLYVGFILSALPKAKVVWLDRSVEDTMISSFRQLFAIDFPFYHYSYDLSDTYRYYQAHHKLAKIWLARFPENFYRLDYHAFVENPKHHGKLLYDFIGEPWSDSYLSLKENASPVATASAVQVRDQISNKSVGFWRHYRDEVDNAIKLGKGVLSNR